MKVINVETLQNLEEKFAVAIGFFDGIHPGHQEVIHHAARYAKENQIKSLVMTFDKSPKVVLGSAENEGYLTPTDEKLRLLEAMGIDYVLVLNCDPTFLNLSAVSFIQAYLLKIGVCYVSVGFDFKFGQGGAGDPELLKSYDSFEVKVCEPVMRAGVKVSSRSIKAYLKQGELETVNQMLGRPFSVSGEVVGGKRIGRTIGFPTANLKLNPDYLFSLRGVYATISHVSDERFVSMTNIGFNPTVNPQSSLSIETCIFGLDEEIYGKQLRLEFLGKIRDEVKFANKDTLIAQLEKDRGIAKSIAIQALKTCV
ncbi:MAG: bifunctional riboflavin kinase/FAD synthetase [Defluviitaleaceae bacterium]|nr:bifunctional riboflavin kinase/FAD synthetase [Defluviitaleaceae bacterium]